MSTTTQNPDTLEVTKFYTRARKFPQLIGKLQDGRAIWGGPYTISQALAGMGTAGALYFTRGLWAHFGVLMNLGVGLGSSWAVVRFMGKLPPGARNPIGLLWGAYSAITAPATGRLRGRALVSPRANSVRHRIHIARTTLPPVPAHVGPSVGGHQLGVGHQPTRPAPAPNPAPAAEPAPTRAVEKAPEASRPVLTGVQALLASIPTTTNSTEDQ